jgi:hypothetical protein
MCLLGLCVEGVMYLLGLCVEGVMCLLGPCVEDVMCLLGLCVEGVMCLLGLCVEGVMCLLGLCVEGVMCLLGLCVEGVMCLSVSRKLIFKHCLDELPSVNVLNYSLCNGGNLKTTFFFPPVSALIKIMSATSLTVMCYFHWATQFFKYKCSESVIIESQFWNFLGC